MSKNNRHSRRSHLALMAGCAASTAFGAAPPDADKKQLSAASKRALTYTKGPEWFCYFKMESVTGDLAYEEGVHRRDPSAVIKVNDLYICLVHEVARSLFRIRNWRPDKEGLPLGSVRSLVRDVEGRPQLEGAGPRGWPRACRIV